MTTPLISDEGKKLAKSALNEGAQDDLNREQAWWESRRTATAEDMFKGFGAQWLMETTGKKKLSPYMACVWHVPDTYVSVTWHVWDPLQFGAFGAFGAF